MMTLESTRIKISISLSILFSQCKVSLCERKTHVVSSLLVNVGENCCSISVQKTSKQIFFTICSQSENIDSELKEHALNYANELHILVSVRLAFQKLYQTRQTSRNNK